VRDSRAIGLRYSEGGWISAAGDASGRTNLFAHDAAGRLTAVTGGDGAQVTLAHDPHGNVVSFTPPGRPAHTLAYSAVDILTGYTAPAAPGVSNRTTTWTYDTDRRLVGTTRPDGSYVTNIHDGTGHTRAQVIAEGAYLFDWHTNGLPSRIAAPGGVVLTNAYDGSLITRTEWTGPVTGSIDFTYNEDFRIRSLSVNGGYTVDYVYDPDGLVTNAGACAYTRQPENGLLTGVTLDQVQETLGYNQYGEVSSQDASSPAGPLLSVSYGFDLGGLITSRVETAESATTTYRYGYDGAGRLTSVVADGATGVTTNSYFYDANGNCTSALVGTEARIAQYDAQDRLVSRQTAAGTTVYAYNDAGDLARKTVDGSNTLYRYDALGNLREAALPGGDSIAYLVDGHNRRVGKNVNGTPVWGLLYAGSLSPLAQLDGAGNVVNVFVYGRHENVPDYMVRSGVTYRIVIDHLGSVRRVVNAATGEIAQRLDYDEWGRVLADSAPGFQPFGFAGGLYDPDTGLVRFLRRDYDPEVGRWTAKDPILFKGGSGNLYAYCGDNPVNEVDPTGTTAGGQTQPYPLPVAYADGGLNKPWAQSYYVLEGTGGPKKASRSAYPNACIFIGSWDLPGDKLNAPPDPVTRRSSNYDDFDITAWGGNNWKDSEDPVFVFTPSGTVKTNRLPNFDGKFHILVTNGVA
jgi:RHS repeat-associated protein